ncbi:hypothetical protein ACIRG5_38820 [Lentzea sp. NPDC102401]|uniref:hypothetical protein n=1 Tax=Lentzea sp. NPDC102401 TaxID=3364128 RepID=UPI00381EA729
MRRTAALAVLTAAGLCAGTVPALADDIFGGTSCSQAPSAECNVSAGTRPPGQVTSQGHHNTGSNDEAGEDAFACRHVPVDGQPPEGQQKESGGWFMVLCSPDGKDLDSHGPIWISAGAQRPAPPSPEQVAQIARKRLQMPRPAISASPGGTQLVNLPTWLWLANGWAPVSATASVPGVSVTAVAKPVSVTWSMGDGGSVTCSTSGTPYTADHDPKGLSPDCGYTYRKSSAGQPAEAFSVTATVNWTVTWSGAGQTGEFPNMTTSAATTLRVAESQGITTG